MNFTKEILTDCNIMAPKQIKPLVVVFGIQIVRNFYIVGWWGYTPYPVPENSYSIDAGICMVLYDDISPYNI